MGDPHGHTSLEPQQEKAYNTLQYILQTDASIAPGVSADAKSKVGVDKELRARPILDHDTGRTRSRILFFTTDESYLEQNSIALEQMRTRSEYFDELHIVVLRTGKSLREPVRRIGPRVWVYTVTTTHWWWTPFAAKDYVRKHLTFGDTFRPDIIVALEPYEAGLAAVRCAQAFERAVQIHVPEDIFSTRVQEKLPHRNWQLRMAHYALKKVKSVRTSTNEQAEAIKAHFAHLTDVLPLPSYFDVRTIMNATPKADLSERCSQYRFIILYHGELDEKSKAQEALDASRFALQSPGIGMCVLGEGSERKSLFKRTQLLNITSQVEFVPRPDDLITYYKGANVAFVPETDQKADEQVLAYAAAGLPVIAAATELRKDLFVSGEQMYLFEPGNITQATEQLNDLLNNVALRKRFAREAKDVVADRLVQDPDHYHQVYRASLELALFA